MNFAAIPEGSSVFFDANTLVYHFTGEPQYGVACSALIRRVASGEVRGFVSTDVLSDTAHRLMTLEAMQLHGWPQAGLAARLRKHHAEIARLTIHRQALAATSSLGLQALSITPALIDSAATLTVRFQLLMGDALIVAVMQAQGLLNLASTDRDFDRVPVITRYGPM